MTTLAQMENELRAMRLTDGLVRRVMTMADREGCSPTERYMWLAWTAMNMLRTVQAEALRVAREAPPAPILIHTREAKALAELVVVWWANTKTGNWQRDPDCVTKAKKILEQADATNFADIVVSLGAGLMYGVIRKTAESDAEFDARVTEVKRSI